MVTRKEKQGRRKRLWVRLDCNGVLHGSMNSFLTLEEQAVFIKLILMAEMYGETPGLISDNDGNPLPHEFIAYELHASVEVFESTLKKCIEKQSIRENSSGIELVNFNKYQFTEYDRQLPYRLAKKERDYKAGAYGGMVCKTEDDVARIKESRGGK